LRAPEERHPSGAPKEEFGRMIFKNKSSLGDRTKVQSTPWAAVRGGESGSGLLKTAIFPKIEERKREIFNESARGSSLRKANV